MSGTAFDYELRGPGRLLGAYHDSDAWPPTPSGKRQYLDRLASSAVPFGEGNDRRVMGPVDPMPVGGEVRRCRKCGVVQTVRNIYRDPRGVVRCRPCRRAARPLKKRVCVGEYCGATFGGKGTSPYCEACRAKNATEKARKAGLAHGTRVCAECDLRLPVGEFRIEHAVAKGGKAYHEKCEDCRLGDEVALPGSPGWHATHVILEITGLATPQYSRSGDHPANLLWFALGCRWAAIDRSHSCWGDVDLGLQLCDREGLLVLDLGHARSVITERDRQLGWQAPETAGAVAAA